MGEFHLTVGQDGAVVDVRLTKVLEAVEPLRGGSVAQVVDDGEQDVFAVKEEELLAECDHLTVRRVGLILPVDVELEACLDFCGLLDGILDGEAREVGCFSSSEKGAVDTLRILR